MKCDMKNIKELPLYIAEGPCTGESITLEETCNCPLAMAHVHGENEEVFLVLVRGTHQI